MQNDENQDITSPETKEEQESEETPEVDYEAKYKETETLLKSKEDEIAKWKAIAERRAKKASKPTEKTEPQTTDELDYAQKAYLRAEGIETAEFDFVQSQLEESGKTIEQLLASKYFQTELKERREAKQVENATPTGDRIPSNNAKSTKEYWLSRGELPPNTPENRKLREEVVNARYEREKSAYKFV